MNTVFEKQKRSGPILFSEYEHGSGIEKALKMDRNEILNELRDSKLKGRGGAGFPTSTKWMIVAAANNEKKYVR